MHGADLSFGISTNRGLIYVDTVFINGQMAIGSFIIDTGAGISVIDRNFADKLTIRQSRFRRVIRVRDMLGHRVIVPRVNIDSIRIGERNFGRFNAVIMDLRGYVEGLDGIIGACLLKSDVWIFDLQSNIVTVTNRDVQNEFSHSAPIRLNRHNQPTLSLQVGNQIFRDFIIDTGIVSSLLFHPRDAGLLDELATNYHYNFVMSRSLNQRTPVDSKIKIYRFENISINGVGIGTVSGATFARRLIGLDFFYNSVFAIDYPNRRLYFNDLNPRAGGRFGSSFRRNNAGELEVVLVRQNSSAYEAGIRLGDILVYWQGYENLNELYEEIQRGKLRDPQIKSVVIRINRWDENREIFLE